LHWTTLSPGISAATPYNTNRVSEPPSQARGQASEQGQRKRKVARKAQGQPEGQVKRLTKRTRERSNKERSQIAATEQANLSRRELPWRKLSACRAGIPVDATSPSKKHPNHPKTARTNQKKARKQCKSTTKLQEKQ